MGLTFQRPCIDCGNLIPSGSRCASCQPAQTQQRGTTTARGYGSQWRRISDQVVAEEGMCIDCGHVGTPDNPLTADHVVAKANGGTDDRDNLVCRCRRHNSAKGSRR